MSNALRSFVRAHPVPSYFAVTFAISWGGLLLIVGPSRIVGTPAEFERLFPIALPVIALGPPLAGLLSTSLVHGRAGLRDLRARMLRSRVAPRWYAAALLTAPLYFLAVELALSVFSREYLPAVFVASDRASLVLRGMAAALVAGIVEEVGWTGFAVPEARRRHGAIATGLIVGAMWGVWHVLPKIWGAAAHGVVAHLPVDLASAIVGLTGFRILMVWVWDRTESVLIAILMHLGLTASTLILQPQLTGAPLVKVGLVLSAAPWALVAVVMLFEQRRGRRTEPPWTPRPAH